MMAEDVTNFKVYWIVGLLLVKRFYKDIICFHA